MKSIEERAYSRYAENGCPHDCEKCEMRTDCTDVDYVWAFIEGAQSEHEELTRWHDPEEELPEPMKYVLVKYDDGYYAVDFFDPNLESFYTESLATDKIIGWREIHE